MSQAHTVTKATLQSFTGPGMDQLHLAQGLPGTHKTLGWPAPGKEERTSPETQDEDPQVRHGDTGKKFPTPKKGMSHLNSTF